MGLFGTSAPVAPEPVHLVDHREHYCLAAPLPNEISLSTVAAEQAGTKSAVRKKIKPPSAFAMKKPSCCPASQRRTCLIRTGWLLWLPGFFTAFVGFIYLGLYDAQRAQTIDNYNYAVRTWSTVAAAFEAAGPYSVRIDRTIELNMTQDSQDDYTIDWESTNYPVEPYPTGPRLAYVTTVSPFNTTLVPLPYRSALVRNVSVFDGDGQLVFTAPITFSGWWRYGTTYSRRCASAGGSYGGSQCVFYFPPAPSEGDTSVCLAVNIFAPRGSPEAFAGGCVPLNPSVAYVRTIGNDDAEGQTTSLGEPDRLAAVQLAFENSFAPVANWAPGAFKIVLRAATDPYVAVVQGTRGSLVFPLKPRFLYLQGAPLVPIGVGLMIPLSAVFLRVLWLTSGDTFCPGALDADFDGGADADADADGDAESGSARKGEMDGSSGSFNGSGSRRRDSIIMVPSTRRYSALGPSQLALGGVAAAGVGMGTAPGAAAGDAAGSPGDAAIVVASPGRPGSSGAGAGTGAGGLAESSLMLPPVKALSIRLPSSRPRVDASEPVKGTDAAAAGTGAESARFSPGRAEAAADGRPSSRSGLLQAGPAGLSAGAADASLSLRPASPGSAVSGGGSAAVLGGVSASGRMTSRGVVPSGGVTMPDSTGGDPSAVKAAASPSAASPHHSRSAPVLFSLAAAPADTGGSASAAAAAFAADSGSPSAAGPASGGSSPIAAGGAVASASASASASGGAPAASGGSSPSVSVPPLDFEKLPQGRAQSAGQAAGAPAPAPAPAPAKNRMQQLKRSLSTRHLDGSAAAPAASPGKKGSKKGVSGSSKGIMPGASAAAGAANAAAKSPTPSARAAGSYASLVSQRGPEKPRTDDDWDRPMTAREVYRLPWRLRFRRFWAFYMEATLAAIERWVFECVCIRGEKIEKFKPSVLPPVEISPEEAEAAAADAKPIFSYNDDIVPVAQKASAVRKKANEEKEAKEAKDAKDADKAKEMAGAK